MFSVGYYLGVKFVAQKRAFCYSERTKPVVARNRRRTRIQVSYEIATVFDCRFHIVVFRIGMPRRRDYSVVRQILAEFAVFIVFGRVRPSRYTVSELFDQAFVIVFYRRSYKCGTLRSALFRRQIRTFEMNPYDVAFNPAGLFRRDNGSDGFFHRRECPRGYGRQYRRRSVRQMKVTGGYGILFCPVYKRMSSASVGVHVYKPRRNVSARKIVTFVGRLTFFVKSVYKTFIYI